MERRDRPAASDCGGRFITVDRLVPREHEFVDGPAQRGRKSGDRAERIQATVREPLRYVRIIPDPGALTAAPIAIKTSNGSRKALGRAPEQSRGALR